MSEGEQAEAVFATVEGILRQCFVYAIHRHGRLEEGLHVIDELAIYDPEFMAAFVGAYHTLMRSAALEACR